MINVIVEVLTANNITKEAGLHGRTITPKNIPKRSEDKYGFCKTGAVFFGKNLPKSTLKISRTLTTANIEKAIGEAMLITLVNDSCRKKVKIKPTKNIDKTTPAVTISPNMIIVFFSSLPFNFPLR